MSLLRAIACRLGFHRPHVRGSDAGAVYLCGDCRRVVIGKGYRHE